MHKIERVFIDARRYYIYIYIIYNVRERKREIIIIVIIMIIKYNILYVNIFDELY